ncbi:hypothetical protein GCM10022277_33710 [Litoribacillus peritrichatus]|uniref:Uncharacterized protein n=2 Tax=Litoribacillus peritrichatus TaxID=718191 RepID=A0ABP7N1K0_9GAMM
MDLWVSNGAKDWFCEIVVSGAKLRNRDISSVFDSEPLIAGCYGISGLGINMSAFFPYFGGKEDFIEHLEFCISNSEGLCESGQSETSLVHILSWAKYILPGGRIRDDINVYSTLPAFKL